MSRLCIILCCILLTVPAGCSVEKFLNSMVPEEGYRIVSGIAYGNDARQKLDIYIPDAPRKTTCTVVFYPGGAWNSGERALYKFAGQAFASQGCVAAVADYRLYPAVHYPAFVEDSALAFVWVHAHIAEYGGDPARIFLSGHSAGAYNAVMTAVHPQFLKNAGGRIEWIKGVIGIAGPYDFKPSEEEKDIRAAFSTAADAATQPVTYVTGKFPPMLLATGEHDRRVKPRNTASLAKKLRAADSPVTVVSYPPASHMSIILSLVVYNREKIPLLRDIMSFIDTRK